MTPSSRPAVTVPTILVSNDDGIRSPGLAALAEALSEVGEVVVVAPTTEQSAAGHSLTLHHPLRIEELGDGRYAVDGTPTDAVYLGIVQVLGGRRPDLCVSGINLGANLGDDITYSGTVAAAMEATLMGTPSFAVSLAGRADHRFDVAADFARRMAWQVLERGLPPATLLNVNVPPLEADAAEPPWRVTRQGKRNYADAVLDRTDPRGRTYYWIGGEDLGYDEGDDTDAVAVLRDRHISVTPVRLDLTHHELLDEVGGWDL